MKTIGKILPKILVQLLAVVACIGIPILEETYAPVLRERDAGDVEKAQHFHHPAVGMGKWAYMWVNLSRPVILLTRSLSALS